jgi:hypothetical protein
MFVTLDADFKGISRFREAANAGTDDEQHRTGDKTVDGLHLSSWHADRSRTRHCSLQQREVLSFSSSLADCGRVAVRKRQRNRPRGPRRAGR